ncbi:MAG TPA: hypothetical protein VN451_10485 [Chitinophagaceae bacterium]|nr:hypothetical protein [Chitinophagaceae bacterium]
MVEKIYYIREFAAPEASFGFQAQLESILDKKGFVPVLYPRSNYFRRFFFLLKLFFAIPRHSVIFFLHPLYARTNRIILRWLLWKGSRPVCIVSDINSIRFNLPLEEEIGYWKKLRYFIFQNEKMKEFVEDKAGEKVSVNIDLFDLLFDVPAPVRKNSNRVVFAGNIEKCPFINDLHRVKDIQWMIYSSTFVTKHDNINSVLLSDEIKDKKAPDGSYGLVWEGSSIENISGSGGEYLRLVSPLKLSNYLLSGLPVIIHKEAAMAGFILENKIGFCVESLFGIGKKIEKIPEYEYQSMCLRVRQIGNKISAGGFTEEVVEKILKKIK